MILIDTNIFVEILQNSPAGQKAVDVLEAADPDEKFSYSAITWFELCAKPLQREAARELLKGFEAVPLTLGIAEAAAEIFQKYLSGNRRHIPDAFIAATAAALHASLWTMNRSDFKRVPHFRFYLE